MKITYNGIEYVACLGDKGNYVTKQVLDSGATYWEIRFMVPGLNWYVNCTFDEDPAALRLGEVVDKLTNTLNESDSQLLQISAYVHDNHQYNGVEVVK